MKFRSVKPLLAGSLLCWLTFAACSTTEQQVDELLDTLAGNEIGSDEWNRAVDGLVEIGRPAARQLSAHLDPAKYVGDNYREHRLEIEKIRTGCARALGRIKPRAAGPKLAACITKTFTDSERLACLWGVGEIGFDQASVDALKKELKREETAPAEIAAENPMIRVQLAISMIKMDEYLAVDEISSAISGADQELAGQALDGLSNANYFGVPLLVELAGKSAARKAEIAAVLEEVKGQLIRQLNAEEPEIRYQSARALGRIGDRTVAADLISVLDDPSNLVRFNAAAALANMDDDEGIRFLFEPLRNDDPTLRLNAVRFLTEVQRQTGAVEKDLIDALDGSDPLSRSGAAQVLGQAEVAASVPALLGATKSDAAEVRWNAAIALGQIGRAESRGRLQELLTDTDATVAYYARWALKQLGQT